MRIRSALLSFCLIIPASMASVHAQPGAFTIRSDVEMVSVEVAAIDKEGRPVRNLKKEEFEIHEEGKRQQILTLDEVSSESGASALGVSPLDVGDAQGRRIVVIIFGYGDIDPLNHTVVRDTAARFVTKHMRPQDLFAIGVCGRSRSMLIQSLTGEREEVLAAIRRPLQDDELVGSAGINFFEGIIRALAPIKGRKSILVYTQRGPSVNGRRWLKETLSAARKANVVFYTLEPTTLEGPLTAGRGVSVGSNGLPVPGSSSAVVGAELTRMRTPWMLRDFAADSGGSSIYDTNNLDAALDTLAAQISSYYVLGFEFNNAKHDGSFRTLKIKAKAKGVTLRHSYGYQDRRPTDVLADSKRTKALLAALAAPVKAAQLPMTMRPAYFYDSLRTARVLVNAGIPLEAVAFKKVDDRIGADLSLMGAAYAEDGSIAARFSETVPLRFDKGKEAEARKERLPYRNYFKLRPGKYRLKVVVSDESDNLGATEQTLEVPVVSGKEFAASSLVVAGQLSALPELIRNLQTQLFDQSDPFLYGKMQIEPSIENRLPPNAPVDVLFRLYNLPASPENCDFVANATLVDEKGARHALAPMPLREALSPTGSGEAAVLLRLPFKGVPPGKYRLAIKLIENGSSQAATLETDVELQPR